MKISMIIFASVFMLVMGVLNFYIYRRLFKPAPTKVRQAGLIMVLLLVTGEILMIAHRALGLLGDSLPIHLATISSIGITFMLAVVTFIYDLATTANKKIPFNPERREAIQTVLNASVAVATVSYLTKGFIEGGSSPDTNRVEVKIKDFPVDGFTIVQISDLHVGDTIRRPFVLEVVKRVNGMNPDMVVITGDLLDLPAYEIYHDLVPLSEIKAPTYFVTGNHEYFRGVHVALEAMKKLGIKALTNQHLVIEHDQGKFNLVGLNDLAGNRFKVMPCDLEEAYIGLDATLPTIVLAHQPKTILKFKQERCDLMLSGHTHGGQIFPFGVLVKMDQPYIAGLHQHQPGQQIFVSRGTGYWGPPIRVFAPSEITHITIRKG